MFTNEAPLFAQSVHTKFICSHNAMLCSACLHIVTLCTQCLHTFVRSSFMEHYIIHAVPLCTTLCSSAGFIPLKTRKRTQGFLADLELDATNKLRSSACSDDMHVWAGFLCTKCRSVRRDDGESSCRRPG